ncbi:hypothetical protein CY0110_23266 [Crocosphaera chwakensis CCY0110]|uniref:Uncharacterized protein n=1 Tax=Crocosphaera chwakensis CCY0110 TaxID=391612 RepID=A3IUX8_9CHRO|nr:hypothetical protein CY0110_23266 [Crocosphaera chwakensis CCY0110]
MFNSQKRGGRKVKDFGLGLMNVSCLIIKFDANLVSK